jgi:hypothetical protein
VAFEDLSAMAKSRKYNLNSPLSLNWNGFDFSRLASIATVPDAPIAF